MAIFFKYCTVLYRSVLNEFVLRRGRMHVHRVPWGAVSALPLHVVSADIQSSYCTVHFQPSTNKYIFFSIRFELKHVHVSPGTYDKYGTIQPPRT